MRYFTGSFISDTGEKAEGFSVHAVDQRPGDPRDGELYTYIQELKSWNRDLMIEDHFFFPDLHTGDSGQVVFEELPYSDVPVAMSLVKKFDRRDEAQRRISNKVRGQIRKSGQVLTSAEVGILTKDLGQRPAAAPMLKELIETRSQHKRWTALMLYADDGATRRKAVSTLRANERLNVNSRGQPLEAQHRWRNFEIEGETRRFLAVEVKYVRAADQGLKDGQGGPDD